MAKYKLPPRQQMINLLYIILIAMLAINISSETLDTYSILNDDSINKIESLQHFNKSIADSIKNQAPEKAKTLDRIYVLTNNILKELESLQKEIVRNADNIKEGEAGLIPDKKEDLNAVPYTMLSITSQKAYHLKKNLEILRDSLSNIIRDKNAKELISSWLTMKDRGVATSWEKGTFSSMSAMAGITYLNILKENVLMANAEAARIYYEENKDTQGYQYNENDSEADRNFVVVNNSKIIVDTNGIMDLPVVGMETKWSNIIYSGYQNTININLVGTSHDNLRLSAKGGQISMKNDKCVIFPDKDAKNVIVSVISKRNGKDKLVLKKTFIVKPLPTPEPYIEYKENGIVKQCKGNTPLKHESLINIRKVGAFIGSPINENINVSEFEIVLVKNNSSQVISARNKNNILSAEQIDILKKAQKGDKVYFTSIKSKNKNGTETALASISVIIY